MSAPPEDTEDEKDADGEEFMVDAEEGVTDVVEGMRDEEPSDDP